MCNRSQCNQRQSKMPLITFAHGTTVQVKNLKLPWYELVKPDTVQQIQEAEIELGSCLVAERLNARILEQIARGSVRLSHDQFKFHLCDKASCLQHCQVLERLARLELIELDAIVQIQKMWRRVKRRERWIYSWRRPGWWSGECAAVKIQRFWHGVQTRKGKTPNSWWIEPMRAWIKQVACPHRSMIWIHPPEAGPPL